AVARSAGYGRVETPRGAVARNSRAGGVLRDLQTSAVDVERADVAVAEVRRENESVIRRDREPAQLGWETGARVDLRQSADVEITASVDGSDGAPVADGVSEDEGIRPAVKESDVERRGRLPILERGLPEGAVLVDGEHDETVGIGRV